MTWPSQNWPASHRIELSTRLSVATPADLSVVVEHIVKDSATWQMLYRRVYRTTYLAALGHTLLPQVTAAVADRQDAQRSPFAVLSLKALDSLEDMVLTRDETCIPVVRCPSVALVPAHATRLLRSFYAEAGHPAFRIGVVGVHVQNRLKYVCHNPTGPPVFLSADHGRWTGEGLLGWSLRTADVGVEVNLPRPCPASEVASAHRTVGSFGEAIAERYGLPRVAHPKYIDAVLESEAVA